MREIAIIDAADQQFGMILNKRRVTMRVRFNVTTDRWSFDLSVDDLPKVHGRRIVTGVDLLEPYDLGLGMIFALANAGDDPTRTALPSGLVRLYHASPDEVNEYNASVST